MPRRPAKCYRYQTRPPYTRKEYIKGAPDPKIRIYDMGAKNKVFPIYLTLCSLEKGQVSHNALEAARMSVNRFLTKMLTRERYHLRIRAHPHHVIRENRMMAFAGADRLQDGMRKAFGKPSGRAARVDLGSPLVTVGVYEDSVKTALEALRRAAMKFPIKSRVFVEKAPEEIVKRLGLSWISEVKKT